jgi:hypothetical protein
MFKCTVLLIKPLIKHIWHYKNILILLHFMVQTLMPVLVSEVIPSLQWMSLNSPSVRSLCYCLFKEPVIIHMLHMLEMHKLLLKPVPQCSKLSITCIGIIWFADYLCMTVQYFHT